MICKHCHRIIKENEKGVKRGIRVYHESCKIIIEQQEEQSKKGRIKQQQSNLSFKEIELKNLAQQGITSVAEPIVKPLKRYNENESSEYQAVMADIKEEIREYKDIYGDKAMDHMKFDAVIEELTREVTAKEMITMFKHQLQCENERECKEWDKQFEGGQPVKWELTTNNPLEVFHRIRYGRI